MKHALQQGWIVVLALVALEPAMILAQTAPAKVAYVEGKVFIRRGMNGTVEEAEVGTGVFRGDTILTQAGRAQVNLAASGVLRLSANTTINLPFESDPTGRIGVRKLPEGKTWVDVAKLGHDEIFECRVPTLVAGTSDAIRPGGALSDYIIGMPVSDEEIDHSMSRRGASSSWPPVTTVATTGSSMQPPSTRDTGTRHDRDVTLGAQLMISVPDDLPGNWWPNRFTKPFPKLEGVPQRVTNDGTPFEWEQHFSISNETGAEWNGSGYFIRYPARLAKFMTVSAFLQPRYSTWTQEGKSANIDDRERLEALVANNPDCRWLDEDHTANIWLRDGNLAEINFVRRNVSVMVRVAFPNGARDAYTIGDCTSVVKHFHQVMLKKIDAAARDDSSR